MRLHVESLKRCLFIGLAVLPSMLLAQDRPWPLGKPPQWHVVHQSPELRSEMDKAGVYTRGAWTYVAMREWERNAPEAFTLLAMAFHCRDKRVAIAAMGRMSPDGAQVDQAPMNAEALLSKYNSPLAQSVTAGAAVAFAAVCER